MGRDSAARAICLLLVLVLGAEPAFAQGGNTAAAEAFFQDGRALYDAGKFAEACPKLAESQRLDPATGTLLALALCHEAEGKLASAWAEFADAQGRAQREGRPDREKVASDRVAALRPRLSTLAVDVPPDVANVVGLDVRVDGVAVGKASFGVPLPVDGGEHRVEAAAPGKARWSGVATVKVEQDAVRVAVPVLADEAQAPPVAAAPAAAATSESSSGGWMRPAGLVTAGVGVVALGVGGYLALDAKTEYSNAREECAGLNCTQEPYDQIDGARKQGTTATIVMVVGGVALGTGAVLWLLAPSGDEGGSAKAARARVERIGVGPAGVTMRGTF